MLTVYSLMCFDIGIHRWNHNYNKESEGAIRWNDPTIGVEWGIEEPIVSEKDGIAPLFDDEAFPYFEYKE